MNFSQRLREVMQRISIKIHKWCVIQEMFNMRNGDSFKITTGRYLTRNGRDINQKGIEPDVYVTNNTEPIDVTKYRTIDYSKATSFEDTDENISVIKERLKLLGYRINNDDNYFDADFINGMFTQEQTN